MRVCCLTLLVSCLTFPAFGVEIIAHRGASYDAPENTLSAVNLGWKVDADAVEIDIRLTADGRIALMHDESAKRTGGRDVPIAKATLAELKKLDVGRWKAQQFAGERIPTLEEVLRTIPDGKRLFIEIKSGPEILPELKRVLDAAGKPPSQTPLICFSYETMQAAKRLMPGLKMYWLVKYERNKKTGQLNHTAKELIELAKAADLDGLDLGNTPPLDQDFVRAVKSSGLKLYVYTINDVEKARQYQNLGVDGITTDRPRYLKKELEAPSR